MNYSDENTERPQYQANVTMWLNCNLKCAYCWAAPTAPPRQWPPEIEEGLQQLAGFLTETGQWTLSFSGGEPLIYPGFAAYCSDLAAAGHRVQFYTNGTISLAKAFPGDTIKDIDRVTLSYHPPVETKPRVDAVFDANTCFLREHGVDFDVSYVLYPGRVHDPATIRERFQSQGAKVLFRAFQGEKGGEHYPFAYQETEKESFNKVGDIMARFTMEHGNHTPTFKKCRAGQETFFINMRSGGVHVCEQLVMPELTNFTADGAAAQFKTKVLAEPKTCPAKRCYCRLTIPQEEFLATHDLWDMDNYPEWEQISLPVEAASKHWGGREEAFMDEIVTRFSGQEIYLWGGGIHSLFLLGLFQARGFDMSLIKGIIDSNALKHGRNILNIPIISRAHFDEFGADACSDILISSRASEAEICRDIKTTYQDRYNIVCLYDGSIKSQGNSVDECFNF